MNQISLTIHLFNQSKKGNLCRAESGFFLFLRNPKVNLKIQKNKKKANKYLLQNNID